MMKDVHYYSKMRSVKCRFLHTQIKLLQYNNVIGAYIMDIKSLVLRNFEQTSSAKTHKFLFNVAPLEDCLSITSNFCLPSLPKILY